MDFLCSDGEPHFEEELLAFQKQDCTQKAKHYILRKMDSADSTLVYFGVHPVAPLVR
jgi:hypothetical protein